MTNPIFTYSHTVYFADTDAAKVVHHSNHIKYLEAGRIEALKQIDYPYYKMQENSVGLAPIKIDISYKHPLRLEDRYTVHTTLLSHTRITLTLYQKITCNDHTCVEATVTLACLDESHYKPVRLPDPLVKRLSCSS